MRHWVDAIPALKIALSKHFPDVDVKSVEEWADDIYEHASAANSMERLERSDKRPINDSEQLDAAAKNLRIAAKKLEGLGWHGGKSLTIISREVRQMNEDLPGLPLMGALDSGPFLAGFLQALAERLTKCAEDIHPNAAPVMSALDENAKRNTGVGARQKTGAHFTSRKAYDAFRILAGKTPSVATTDGKAYGPFLDFLKDIFDCLSIDASPETWAREVCREKCEK
ncbi:hypothetical protein FIU94_16685 [Sulfitobacter sp. THAF37]|uniref:hypothetical protein n=1 Tax=Sulfitobacter sp. THAF37 TaxID=2587855 RepID=UPI0012680C36|nr:hypothetical protein [Sulfitobacter sp. THAF37]QFT60468.1 hypothetical protein FIU94_16685 [Sulfitobacter sp. THAF37]